MRLKKQILMSVLGLFFALGIAHADLKIDKDELLYIVQPGDTLYNISEGYLDNPKHWRELAENAQIKLPKQLQPGQVIRLPIDLLRHEKKELRVAFQRGHSVVTIGKSSQPLTRGMILKEGQTIKTGDDGFVSLELPDKSKLFLSANSSLRINQFRYVPDAKKDLVEFILEEGSVDTSVAAQGQSSRFRVSTPISVTGVRGTRFGVSFDSKSGTQTNNVTEGAIDMAPMDKKGRSKHAGRTEGRDSITGAAVKISAGEGAVMSASMSKPEVAELISAPDLRQWPQYVHSETWVPTPIEHTSAKTFEVRVSPAENDEHVIYESKGTLKTIGPIKEDGVYHVRVRGIDAKGVPGKITVHELHVKTKPVAPLLQTPENDALQIIGEQKLVCTNVPGIKRYYLELSKDEQFTTHTQQISDGNCLFAIEVGELGKYYWRVSSLDESSTEVDVARGKFSGTGYFTIIPKPIVPTASQEKSAEGIVVRWEEEVEGSRYVVQVSEDSSFNKVLLTQETDQTRIVLDYTSSCGQLFVRLRSIEPSGFMSDFSEARELQITQTWCNAGGVAITDGQGVPLNIKK